MGNQFWFMVFGIDLLFKNCIKLYGEKEGYWCDVLKLVEGYQEMHCFEDAALMVWLSLGTQTSWLA